MEKACKVCSVVKPLTDFYGSKQSKDGYAYRCKVCDCAIRKKSRNGPGGEKTREGLRERKLKKAYGLSLQDYADKLESQGNCCAICKTTNPYGEGQEQKRARMSFAVDHNHRSGEVRGLLCNLCNRALGFLRDDIDIVKSAAEYLEKYQGGCH